MADKVRVLHILGSMNMGGIQTFLMNIFRKIDREKYAFDFACMNSKNLFQEEIEALGGNLYCIGSYKEIGVHRKRLYELLDKNEYDYIHIHSGNAICVIDAILVKLRNRKPKVIYHSHNASGRMKEIHTVCKQIIPFVSDIRFACSDDAAVWMFPKRVVDRKSYTVISNGIEVDKFLYSEQVAKEVREELGIKNEFVICHIGRIDVQKNHKYLLQIFAEVLKRKPNAKLLLIGTGPMEELIREQVTQLGISDQVLFLGVRKDVERILCASDVFCLPSLFEGLGIVNIEAQACGLPCFISDVITEDVDITPLIKRNSLQAPSEIWADAICAETATDSNRMKYNKLVAESKYALTYTVDQVCEFYDGKFSKTWKGTS